MSHALDGTQRELAAGAVPLAKKLARVFARSWPRVPEADFLSVGHEAIVGAAHRFRSDLGVPFEAFAYRPVWGAMMDLAHRETFVVQANLRRMAALAVDAPGEVALDEWLGASPSGREQVVEHLRGRAASLLAMAAPAPEAPPPTPEEAFLEREDRARVMDALERAVSGLSEPERDLVQLMYREAHTLDAIADRMGTAKRTVQRLHDRVKQRLAAELLAVRP